MVGKNIIKFPDLVPPPSVMVIMTGLDDLTDKEGLTRMDQEGQKK